MTKSFIAFLSLSLIVILTSTILIPHPNRQTTSSFEVEASGLSSGKSQDSAATPQEISATNQRSALRKILPLAEEGFSVIYDYKKLVFVVTLDQPTDLNRQKFTDWIKSHGFSDIETEKFVFSE